MSGKNREGLGTHLLGGEGSTFKYVLDFITEHSNTGQDLRSSRDKSTLNFTSKKTQVYYA